MSLKMDYAHFYELKNVFLKANTFKLKIRNTMPKIFLFFFHLMLGINLLRLVGQSKSKKIGHKTTVAPYIGRENDNVKVMV